MLPEHFERLQPVCPLCRLAFGEDSPLRIGQVARVEGGDIIEGSLICTNMDCLREHPILDGIPVVLADGASWMANQMLGILRREDLSEFTESILGDLAGAGSAFDRDRGNLSIYAHSHWASDGAGYLPLFESAVGMLDGGPAGVWLDVGCSVGRGTFELARRTGGLAVGVDLNFAMLRMARQVSRSGRVRYSRRRVGLVFDALEHEVGEVSGGEVSFWCADAASLPFGDQVFDGVLSLNMLDCVAAPMGLLSETGRVAVVGSQAVLGTPFDWAAAATQLAAWIGGHSQRSSLESGSSVAQLRALLERMRIGLRIEAERDGVTWRIETNERATMEYRVWMARLRREG